MIYKWLIHSFNRSINQSSVKSPKVPFWLGLVSNYPEHISWVCTGILFRKCKHLPCDFFCFREVWLIYLMWTQADRIYCIVDRIYCMSDESSLAEYQACAGPNIGDVAPWLASLCDCVVWLFPHPALTQVLPEWGHSQKGNIHHHLEKKTQMVLPNIHRKEWKILEMATKKSYRCDLWSQLC